MNTKPRQKEKHFEKDFEKQKILIAFDDMITDMFSNSCSR